MPTPDPLQLIEFVDNEDCVDGISRELRSTMSIEVSQAGLSHQIIAEVADEGHEQTQGLMCREVVPHGTGMLFVFQEAYSLRFWMFNTYAPLDIVYLDPDRRPVRVLQMTPCPRPEGYDRSEWQSYCSSASSGYGSQQDALYALELPADWLTNVGFDINNLETLVFDW